MEFEVGQTVYVSTYNRLRSAKPYCKPHKVMQVTNSRIATCPIPGEEYPSLWLSFGRKNLKHLNRRSKYEYRLYESVEAFNRAVLKGDFD